MSEICGFCNKTVSGDMAYYLGRFECYCCKRCYQEKKYLNGKVIK